MTRTRVAVALLIASLTILIIYGADVMVASSASTASSSSSRNGFLPLNEAARGGLLGGGAVIMSIIGFVISRKQHSSTVSVLLFVNGGTILAGMIALIGQGALSSTNGSNALGTIASTMALGGVLVGLGIWKSLSDRRQLARKQHA